MKNAMLKSRDKNLASEQVIACCDGFWQSSVSEDMIVLLRSYVTGFRGARRSSRANGQIRAAGVACVSSKGKSMILGLSVHQFHCRADDHIIVLN
jgi:hypothetical protein